MKKVMMIAAIAAALVSCQSKNTNHNDSASANEGVTAVAENTAATTIYKGTLPAADGPGVQYVLSLDNLNSAEEGTYTLETTYPEAEGSGKDKSFTSKGKKQVIQKDVNNEKKTAIKLVPDNGDASLYFLIVNDSTLRLVNEELQEAAGELNYDIVLVK
ncbi:NlpE-like protein [Bacteroides zoogleoformans]|uniref:Copper homeostasis protein n=1 Tax=Bacteroides zoogleoformans TaxID=28119 RepID=A0ABM6TAL3_9BACE|nr:copper resistance protein NlpE N-terminal domain-containing protein [Bacteroides zoogleoformans]AVM53935.1 copper homeostasis protein [Bacteroides zoogleoformans]TWJ13937.1 NlpE-like protein [Bacteroides zoogleoformans]